MRQVEAKERNLSYTKSIRSRPASIFTRNAEIHGYRTKQQYNPHRVTFNKYNFF